MKRLYLSVSLLILSAAGILANPPAAVAGIQEITARPTSRPVAIDGVLGPAEWSAAIPVHVTASQPGGPPGVVPWWIQPPDNPADSSFTIYAMFDRSNLYVAVDVADNLLVNDSDIPWLNDDVEVLIDGDRRPGDAEAGVGSGQPNHEGFQLITTVGNIQSTQPPGLPSLVWESRAGRRPRGYLVEVRIPLQSINTHDTSPWTAGTPGLFIPPQPGDTIGFNVTVGDQDVPGSGSYDYPNGYIAWDGNSANWYVFDEQAWGTLQLGP
jgi:hypothetical protein